MTYVMCLTSGILYHLIISSGRGGAADFFCEKRRGFGR